MEYPIILLGLIVVLGLGYIIGMMQGGIKITINHNENKVETPTTEDGAIKYNKSYEDLADPQMKQYFEQNHGQIKL